jgi:putative SOS response-associated peptidase YedK
MCGRFARIVSDKTLREKYRLERIAKLEDRYNISPMQSIAAVRAAVGANELVLLRWGLIPSWSKDAKIAYKLTNARAETVSEKPSFRSAFKQRRCIIPASGFYEWRREAKQKQPFFIRPHDEELFSFAGLWETWRDPEGEIVESCAIITTEANDLMRTIHDRMPVILDTEAESVWLDAQAPVEDLRSLLVPFVSGRMKAYPVDPYVNNAKNQGPKCIEPPSA